MIKGLMIKVLKVYKKYISPALPSGCVYKPTCSEYAMDAIKKHNIIVSLVLIVWRILRCNWFSKGGFDPVPDSHKIKKWVL